MTSPSNNIGKIMTKTVRAAGGTMVALNYPELEANAMRRLVQSIRVKGKQPSLSLIARRSMGLYLDRLERTRAANPEAFAVEMAVLAQMVTPVPKPKPLHLLKVRAE